MNAEYGPLANIVSLAGCIMAAAVAIGLAWNRGAKWQPPEEELPGSTTRVSALLCGVAIVILYTIGSKELGRPGLAKVAGWSVGIAVFALCSTIFLNTVYSFTSKDQTRILGGFQLTSEAKKVIQTRRNPPTVQRMYETGGYVADLVWTRWSRGLVRVLSAVTYLSLQAFGSIGLAASAILLGLNV